MMLLNCVERLMKPNSIIQGYIAFCFLLKGLSFFCLDSVGICTFRLVLTEKQVCPEPKPIVCPE